MTNVPHQPGDEVYTGLHLTVTQKDGTQVDAHVLNVIKPYDEHGREMFRYQGSHGLASWAYSDTLQEADLHG